MDTLIHYGGEVKALGDGKFRAPLVIFGREAMDLDDDFFTPSTDLWQDFTQPVSVPLLYAHGMDPQMKHTRLGGGSATLTRDDAGVWAEGQLDIADRYQATIYKMIEAGRLGTSSGSVAHLVTRKAEGKAFELKSWPIAECSLTPKPCNPLNRVQSVKDFQSLDIPEFKDVMTIKDVMTTTAGYAPQNNRNGGGAVPAPSPKVIAGSQAHDLKPAGHDGNAVRCPSCNLWTHMDVDHQTCPYCGKHLSAEDTPDSTLAGKSVGMSFGDELDSALAAVESCTDRAAGIHALRSTKSGRSISAANREKLRAAHESLAELLRLTEPNPDVAADGPDELLAALTAHEIHHALLTHGG